VLSQGCHRPEDIANVILCDKSAPPCTESRIADDNLRYSERLGKLSRSQNRRRDPVQNLKLRECRRADSIYDIQILHQPRHHWLHHDACELAVKVHNRPLIYTERPADPAMIIGAKEVPASERVSQQGSVRRQCGLGLSTPDTVRLGIQALYSALLIATCLFSGDRRLLAFWHGT
jgi:hypothetical protein